VFVGFQRYVKKYENLVDYIVFDIQDGIENRIEEVQVKDLKKFLRDNDMNNDTTGVRFISKYPSDNFCTMYCYR